MWLPQGVPSSQSVVPSVVTHMLTLSLITSDDLRDYFGKFSLDVTANQNTAKYAQQILATGF